MSKDLYFEYLCDIGLGRSKKDYRKLCNILHRTPFMALVDMDNNRIIDAMDMRVDYFNDHKELQTMEYDHYLNNAKPISVLEVMIALAQRCFYGILDDGDEGDRTNEIFKLMLNNLELLGCTDDNFHEVFVMEVINRFLNRRYDRDGKGSLFYIPNIEHDMREVDLWYQAMWYIDTIIN